MRRGEVWWADFDGQQAVVLLSGEAASGLSAMQVVAPAGTDLNGMAVEVAVGAPEGLPFEGVVRVALPRRGQIPCTWLVTLTREDLIRQAGVLSSAKLSEIEEALRSVPPGETDAAQPTRGRVSG
ncbi:type II toxin-antitoxin system PemK/MazF family toxin [Glycomyces tritici]|uniref:Type II toxin-antitoxin system PemK/MazF family toxin n=1 Tax=Glycomyces tritici TaxID=2665176 RepID=A0ABT7YWU0_9ACTN|nr:type II toxin-antitoxin system PemK/MazF family toxin [Glycomyces tritici]MDN3243106.1 type II toxin-antitoxin system PemK/MazF family toxin [Glycomyces tritici]